MGGAAPVLAGMRGVAPDVGDDVFVKRLREANPGLRNINYAAQAYDAMVITALAAAIAGTDQPAAIAKQINDVTKGGEKCLNFRGCMTLVKDARISLTSALLGRWNFPIPASLAPPL